MHLSHCEHKIIVQKKQIMRVICFETECLDSREMIFRWERDRMWSANAEYQNNNYKREEMLKGKDDNVSGDFNDSLEF